MPETWTKSFTTALAARLTPRELRLRCPGRLEYAKIKAHLYGLLFVCSCNDGVERLVDISMDLEYDAKLKAGLEPEDVDKDLLIAAFKNYFAVGDYVLVRILYRGPGEIEHKYSAEEVRKLEELGELVQYGNENVAPITVGH